MQKWKKALAMFLLVCVAASQCMTAEAATKSSSKPAITLNKTVYTLKKGKSVQLKATLAKGTKKKQVVWSSSNKKIATVSKKGKVKAIKKGTAKITAKIQGTQKKAVCKITVGTPVSKVKLNSKKVTLEVGKTYQLKATLSPKKPTNKKVTYQSNKKSVAKVSKKGIITAVKAGKAKITVMAADGTGKKASCTVVVEKKQASAASPAPTPTPSSINASGITLSEKNLALNPGQTKRLAATVAPSNATNKAVTWSSSNASVASVDANGTVKAIGEGTATVTAQTHNGFRATCSVRSAYPDKVSNQAELNQALSSKMVTQIVYTSNAAGKVTIPEGDYSSKTIEINAPNAEVENNGSFAKVTVNAIAANTYIEHANNVIDFHASQGRIEVGETGIATINLTGGSEQGFRLENDGMVADLNVPAKATLHISGTSRVPVTIGSGAEGASVTTSTGLDITASARWDMAILPGGETTQARVDSQSCMPSIVGLGCIPVTITEDNEVVNIPAEMRDDLGIDQNLNVMGKVQEYNLVDIQTPGEMGETGKRADLSYSAQTCVYLLPYSNANRNLSKENYRDAIAGQEPNAVTDANGDYTIKSVRVGNYWLILEKDGYGPVIKSAFITSSNTDIYSDSTSVLLSDQILACDPAPSISGTVIDGSTGDSVNAEGLQVKLRAGSENVIGEAMQTTLTDAQGGYAFENVPAGVYTVEVVDLRQPSEDGKRYNAASVTILVAHGYLADTGFNCVVTPQLYGISGVGRVQFTLTWGTYESGASSDIDSHLRGPHTDGQGEFHTWYRNKSYADDEGTVADLDVDDIDYEGPEHTTIYRETPGVYRFYVHNFSESGTVGSDMMARSSIQVRVNIGNATQTFNCPNQKGNLWYVCDYNSITHTIIPKNIMSDFTLEAYYIGASDDEIAEMELSSSREDAYDAIDSFRENLLKFKDDEARGALEQKAAEMEEQVGNATSVEQIQEVYNACIELRNQLEESFAWPQITADNLYSCDTEFVNVYDDDGNLVSKRPVIQASLDFGSEAKNFTISSIEGKEITQGAGNDEFAYILHVKDQGTGLSYDVYVRVLENQAEQTLRNEVADCQKYMDLFEQDDEIKADQTKLEGIRESIASMSTAEEVASIQSEIDALLNKYVNLYNAFEIETVSVEGLSLADYWTPVRETETERIPCLALEVYEENYDSVTPEMLDKLSITYCIDGVSGEIQDSDREGFQKMIVTTDGTHTMKRYIYVTIW